MKNLLILICIVSANLLYAQMPDNISKAEKVYGLSKFWQEVNYNFVYLDKIDRKAWDEEYKRLIIEVQNTENDYEYYRMLQRFCAMLKDGHTNVYLPDAIYDSILNTHFGEYRLFLTNINGKPIVSRVNESKKAEIPVGTEIISVNGIPVQKYLQEKVYPYISSSTDYIRVDWGIAKMLEGYIGNKYELKVKLPDGNLKELTLTHAKTEEKEVYPPFKKRELMDFRWFDDKVAYVAINSFSDDLIIKKFKEAIPELRKAKKLIIDLRYNGGGNTTTGLAILKNLSEDSIFYGSKSYSRLHILAFKAWGGFTTEMDTTNDPWQTQAFLSYHDSYYYDFEYTVDSLNKEELANLKNKRIVVPTVILIGHSTASSAEDFLIYADKQEHMTTIGEPTFGSTGQPLFFDLPQGGEARVCTKKDTYPDGKEFIGIGIQPDIAVKKTLSDFVHDHDPVVEKAIEFLNKQK